jgi:hypothetical protein
MLCREALPADIVDLGVAHHEAAHAVVGTLVGIEHEYVELIEEDGGVRGFTRDLPPQWFKNCVASHGTNALDDGQRTYLHAYMMSTLAGALADRQFRSHGLAPPRHEGPDGKALAAGADRGGRADTTAALDGG